MSDVITGLFENIHKANTAIYRLVNVGVTHTDISIIANESYSKDDFAIDEGTKAAEGGIIGATITGAVAALVAGLTTVGAVTTGGAGLLVTGPLVAAFAGGGAGALAGGTIGAVIGAFIPEHEVKYYEDAIEKGSVLIGVKYTKENKDIIENIFKEVNAAKVSAA
tara:strand:+ start:5690 stop:6184 length:495 start_codon:yes stop_codon:yes gene_type:complete